MKVKIIKYVLISVSIVLNFMFYSTMSIFFMILGIAFDTVKSEMFSIGFKRRSNVIIAISFIPVLISIFATMGNFINYTKVETEQVITEEWKQHQEVIKSQEDIVKKSQYDLDNMPTLDEYKGDISSSHSTNITKITKEYKEMNNIKTDNLKQENQKLIDLKSEKIEKYKNVEIGEKEGYRLLFESVSETTGLNVTTLILIMGIIFAITLETFIIILTYNDENNEKSQDEIMQDAIKKISFESMESLVKQIQSLNKSSSSNQSSNDESELQSSSSSSDKKISQSFPNLKDEMKKLTLEESKDFNEVRKVACKEDIQSLSLESKDEKVKISSSSEKDEVRKSSSSSSSSDKKIGFQTSSSDESSKIGFEVQNPIVDKIRTFLKDEKMQGKQFPVAKITTHLNCKRHEVDDLKPLLISEKVIYKANSKSYRVCDEI